MLRRSRPARDALADPPAVIDATSWVSARAADRCPLGDRLAVAPDGSARQDDLEQLDRVGDPAQPLDADGPQLGDPVLFTQDAVDRA